MQIQLKEKETASHMKTERKFSQKGVKKQIAGSWHNQVSILSLVSIMQAQVKNKQAAGLCNPQEKHKTRKLAAVHLVLPHINFTFNQVLFKYCN